MRSTKTAEPWVGQGLGPFGVAVLKPYSRTRFATDGSSVLKVYVGRAPPGPPPPGGPPRPAGGPPGDTG
ncbi:hypothetical protein ACFVZ2_00070, partial [Streptomyces lasiicapitis]